MKKVSTHVLDVAQGKPAENVAVRLEKREHSGAWTLLGSSHTDVDGRCGQLLSGGDTLPAGVYRLAFDTASYYGAQNVDALYPVVEITFQVRDGESQFHIPLLLSPYGYTTYRGS